MQRETVSSDFASVGDYVHVKLDVYRDFYVRVVEVFSGHYIRADDGKVYRMYDCTDRRGEVFYT